MGHRNIPQQSYWKSMQWLIEGIKQESFAILIEDTIVILRHIPEDLNDLDTALALLLIDDRDPLIKFILVKMRGYERLPQEMQAQGRHMEHLLQAPGCSLAHDREGNAILIFELYPLFEVTL